MDPVKPLEIATDQATGWFWFIFMGLLLGGILFGILTYANIEDISKNWKKYRCNPLIMPLASLYGYDTVENFNFCVGFILKSGASKYTGPFGSILSMFIGSLMTVVNVLSSFRVVLSSLMGGITTIFMEIGERFRVLMSNIDQVSKSLNRLMQRMFATFYAIIYMGMSGIQAGQNFSNTFLFNFLNTFCFAPETMIFTKNKGIIPIKDIELGDILAQGQIVNALYKTAADGQEMVKLNGDILVSSNHYVQNLTNGSKWVSADKHPDAIDQGMWTGGLKRPLICLDTNTHTIPIGQYIFSDYTELDETDGETMKTIQDRLNDTYNAPTPSISYAPGLEEHTKIIMRNGTEKSIKDINLEDEISTGKVYAIVKRYQSNMYAYKGEIISGSTLVWNINKWQRVYELPDAHLLSSEYLTYHLLVLTSATIETAYFTCRDFMELHDPDIENITTALLARE